MRRGQIFSSALLLVSCVAVAAGQAQQPPVLRPPRATQVTGAPNRAGNPCNVNRAGEVNPNAEAESHTRLKRLYANVVPPLAGTKASTANDAGKDDGQVKSYVAVYVLTNLGPIGEVYAPSGVDSLKKIDEERETPYYYPSLYFDMSASPMLSLVLGGDKESENYDKQIKKVTNKGINLKWMDMTAELFPWCGNNAKCPEDALRVLEVMPNTTRGGTKDSLPTQLAGTAEELAKLSGPFFPASSFDDKATAATGGITVLFRNLFPPKTETYFHGFVVSPTAFGWNYRENKSKPEEASVMGLHRGVTLLQVRKEVKGIRVISSTLTEWSEAPNPYSDKFDRRLDDVCVWMPEEKTSPPPDYNKLIDLDAFPFLIAKEQVMLILHTNEAGYNALTQAGPDEKPPVLETGPGNSFVKKSSLEKYLGIEKKKPVEKKQKATQEGQQL